MMQDHYNLIYREKERKMLPLCRAEKIGAIPYSPLASGRLRRDWSSESTLRSNGEPVLLGATCFSRSNVYNDIDDRAAGINVNYF